MDRTFLARNAAERERLRALVEGLSDDELARPVGGGWTVAALLAHLAFWDRFVVARWRRAARDGHRVPPPIGDVLLDLINDAAPRHARRSRRPKLPSDSSRGSRMRWPRRS